MHIFTNILANIPKIFSLNKFIYKEIYSLIASLMIMDQLNDDMRDWKEDKQNNILTLVTQRTHNIQSNEQFFEEVMPEINNIITKHYNSARKIIKKYGFRSITNLVEKSYFPAKKIINEQKDIKIIHRFRA